MIDQHLGVDIVLDTHGTHMTMNSRRRTSRLSRVCDDGTSVLQFNGMGFVGNTHDFLIVVQTLQLTFEWNVIIVDTGIEHSLQSKYEGSS